MSRGERLFFGIVVALALITVLAGCGLTWGPGGLGRIHGWKPPQDELFIQLAPGTGWEVRADTLVQDDQGNRVLARQMTLIIMVLGPKRFAGEAPRVTLNGGRSYQFRPSPDHTWTLRFPAGLGQHLVRVEIGDRVWERNLIVWREIQEGEIR